MFSYPLVIALITPFVLIRNTLCFSQFGKVLEREISGDSVCILRNDLSLDNDNIVPTQCRCYFTKLSAYEYECSKGEDGDVNHRICRDKPCQICCKLLLNMGITNEPAISCQKRCFGSPEIENVTETAKLELAVRLWEYTSLFKQKTVSQSVKQGHKTEYNVIQL